MKSVLFALIFGSLLFGCSGSGSSVGGSIAASTVGIIAGATTQAVVSGLQCSNGDAINKAITAELVKLPIFSSVKPQPLTEKGLGSSICSAAVAVVLPVVLGAGLQQVPAEWGCTGDLTKTTITKLAQSACSLVTI